MLNIVSQMYIALILMAQEFKTIMALDQANGGVTDSNSA
jgi:hypothetical protein